jgi:hypothetical protein
MNARADVRRAQHLDVLDVAPGDRAAWPSDGSRYVTGEVVEVTHRLALCFDGKRRPMDVDVTIRSEHVPTVDSWGWPVTEPGTSHRRLSVYGWQSGTGVQLYR